MERARSGTLMTSTSVFSSNAWVILKTGPTEVSTLFVGSDIDTDRAEFDSSRLPQAPSSTRVIRQPARRSWLIKFEPL